MYLLTGNLAELAVVLGASAFGLPLPLSASQLLWINLVTDSLPGIARDHEKGTESSEGASARETGVDPSGMGRVS